MAIGHCPELPPVDPGCYEGPDGDCLPPWCDPARPAADCPSEPPKPPPFCEDGADFCVPPMPPWCDEAGNCDPPPRPPICEEGAEATDDCITLPPECWVDEAGVIGCLPPWCEAGTAAEDCSPEPPLPPVCDENSDPADYCVPPRPPFCEEGADATEDCIKLPPPPPSWCEDGSEVCVPPMPPWCDEAGNCEPPIVCVMGWPSDEPMPDCPVVYPPPCSGGDVESQTAPNAKFRGRSTKCVPPLHCDPIGPDTPEPGSGPADEQTADPTGDDPASDGETTATDPLPCVDPPVYGCFEDEAGNTLCVDPPSDCWKADSRDDLIACFGPTGPGDPVADESGKVERFKGKKAKKAKAAKARKAKARAKAKAAKAKKAKAKARR